MRGDDPLRLQTRDARVDAVGRVSSVPIAVGLTSFLRRSGNTTPSGAAPLGTAREHVPRGW